VFGMKGADSKVCVQLDDAAAQLQSSRGAAEQSKQLAARVKELQVHASLDPPHGVTRAFVAMWLS